MSFPTLYLADTISPNQWFKLLANEKLEQAIELNEEASLVYEVDAINDFLFHDECYPAGIYYMRTHRKRCVDLFDQVFVRKLTFSEIVFLSDIIVSELIPEKEKFDELVKTGNLSDYFEEEMNSIPVNGLEIMRAKVWKRYFNQGIMGFVIRIFSIISNFFNKLLLRCSDIETGITWPGDCCHYADQVVKQIKRHKIVFIKYSYELSKDILSECLEIPLGELEKTEISKLKKLYHDEALHLHPDKNSNPIAHEQFNRLKCAWNDFSALSALQDQFQGEIEKMNKTEMNQFLVSHRFKSLLKLSTSIIAG